MAPLLQLDSGVPHFTVWAYVLYDIDLTYIDPSITVWAFETEVTMPDQTVRVNNGCFNRMIALPYHLECIGHETAQAVSDSIYDERVFHESTWRALKQRQLSFVGNLDGRSYLRRKRAEHATYYGAIISEPHESDPNEVYRISQFALVARGDTPTRKAFYQAINHGCFPVITEDSLAEYTGLYRGQYADMIKSVTLTVPMFVLPRDRLLRPEYIEMELNKNALNSKMHDTLANLPRLLETMQTLALAFQYDTGAVVNEALRATCRGTSDIAVI